MKTILIVVLMTAIVCVGLANRVEAQAGVPTVNGPTVDITEGETKDLELWCKDSSGSKIMTIADAGSVASSKPAVSGATVVDPNGNDGNGQPVGEGQVESPTMRFTGNKAGTSTVTVLVSCPTLFDPTHGIGLGKHKWVKVRITVRVRTRPSVPTENVKPDVGDRAQQGDR